MRAAVTWALAVNILLATYAGPAAAFCAYNTGKEPVTFFAWPVAAQTFKAVVQPGGNACCNFQNPSCFATAEGSTADDPLGQCAPVIFYITPQSVDTGSITSAFIEKSVLDYLSPLIGAVGAILAPFTGGASEAAAAAVSTADAVSITAATTAAGLDVANAAAETGIPFTVNDVFQKGINGGTVTWNGNSSSFTTAVGCSTSSSGRKMLNIPLHPLPLKDGAAAQ